MALQCKPMKNRKTTSFRLSEGARVLLEQISDKLGVDKTAALEIAIRRLAELEKIEAPVKNSI